MESDFAFCVKEHFECLSNCSIELRSFIKNSFAKSSSDKEPLYVLISGQIASQYFIPRYLDITEKEKKEIFMCIECGVATKNNRLATIVCTGFIESLLFRVEDQKAYELEKYLISYMGEKTKEFYLGLKKWEGFNLPEFKND